MKLVLAQGNPESRFDNTRHNVGFFVIDHIAEKYDGKWVEKSKFRASLAEVTIDGEKVLLVKPHTFYNETGQAARSLIDFYSLDVASDILVIHDELALPIGTIRTRKQGSDAGNNGIKSLNNHIGPDYHRIRIGISNEHRVAGEDMNFVLSKFSKAEQDTLVAELPEIEKYIDAFVAGNLEHETITL
jgi:PTH1 family peptidyl-tRNA hydrolase